MSILSACFFFDNSQIRPIHLLIPVHLVPLRNNEPSMLCCDRPIATFAQNPANPELALAFINPKLKPNLDQTSHRCVSRRRHFLPPNIAQPP